MHLLNTTTKELESFDDENLTPPYAILSHTWSEEEVLFNHITGSVDARREGEMRKGYAKIVGACEQAIGDGWEYIWIDTCCINKESSAELSEAINSMYKWYQKSKVCYVYLEDVHSGVHNQKCITKDVKMDGSDKESSSVKTVPFERSRWFSRGWTLQELLAPQYMVFYSRDWVDIGTRASLQDAISTTTGIRVEMLMAYDSKKASVAERMSWAACRKTRRKEDIAYCLMGLFDVNIPLLYGEGDRAFRRLQEEIMKMSDDHSLFAWKGHYSDYTTPDDAYIVSNNYKVQGMLANSPWDFRDGADISNNGAFSPYSMTNQGLQIQLPLQPIDTERGLLNIDSDYTKNTFKVTLKCTIRDKQPTHWIVIYLRMSGKGYERVFAHLLHETKTDPNKSELTSLVVPQVDTAATYNIPGYQRVEMKTLPTEPGFTTNGHSLVEGYEHSDYENLYIAPESTAVTVFNGREGECFAVVIGLKDRLFWLDVIDVKSLKKWRHPQRRKELKWKLKYDIKQAYQEGGHRYNIVLRHLDRLSVRISGWSVVVSAKKFNNRGGPHLRVTVDIQEEPILSRGWYTPSPTSTSDGFDNDLTSYLHGHCVVHPNFKEEHSDWIAIFNPKAERALDVSPVHNITYCSTITRNREEDSFVDFVQFSPDGKYLAARHTGSALRVYDTNTGEPCVLFDEKDTIYNVQCVCFNPNGKSLATGDINGRIVFWDIEKGDVLLEYNDTPTSPSYLCFSLDGRLIVSGSVHGIIRIWDTADGTSHTFTIDHRSYVESVTISPNGRLIAEGSRDSDSVWIWDIVTKQLVKKLEGYNNVAFTSDGERLVIGGRHGLGSLDVGELVPSQVMEGMEGSNGARPDDSPRVSVFVTSVAVSCDRHWVISGSSDGSVQFWDLKEGTVQFMLQEHTGPILSVNMSPVGNIFATGGEGAGVRIWRYDTTKMKKRKKKDEGRRRKKKKKKEGKRDI